MDEIEEDEEKRFEKRLAANRARGMDWPRGGMLGEEAILGAGTLAAPFATSAAIILRVQIDDGRAVQLGVEAVSWPGFVLVDALPGRVYHHRRHHRLDHQHVTGCDSS